MIMPGKKVLIAYGTRYGSTEEISQEMGKTLEKEGLEVQLVDLKKTKSKEWPSLEPFDGVLVGSSIAVGKWMNEPQEFLKKHKAEIKKKEKILGIFVSCGSAMVNPSTRKPLYPEKYEKGIGLSRHKSTFSLPCSLFRGSLAFGGYPTRHIR